MQRPFDSGDGSAVARAIGPLTDRRVLADRVYDAIRQAIFSLELEGGQSLVERELAARFGVSKSPVREALQRLAGDGLVIQSAHRGMSVLRIDPKLADEIYELREVLEEMAVNLATPRLSEHDIAAAETALERSSVAQRQGDLTEVAYYNREFHDTFIRNCGNQPLYEALARLHDRVRIISMIGWRARPSMGGEHDQHMAVLNAVKTRDAGLAGRLMREHVHLFRLTLASTRGL